MLSFTEKRKKESRPIFEGFGREEGEISLVLDILDLRYPRDGGELVSKIRTGDRKHSSPWKSWYCLF